MNKLKSLLLLPALLSVASCPIKAEPICPTTQQNQIVEVNNTIDDNKDYVEKFIIETIKHPDYNYIATYEGTEVFSNAVVRLDNNVYCGNVYLYIINISYFDSDGMTQCQETYELELVVESDGTTAVIHYSK